MLLLIILALALFPPGVGVMVPELNPELKPEFIPELVCEFALDIEPDLGMVREHSNCTPDTDTPFIDMIAFIAGMGSKK